MGLDINLFRPEKGGNPDLIRESVKKRGDDPKIVDEVMALDEEWRKKRFVCDQLRKEYNAANKAVADKKKANKEDPCTDEIAKVKEVEEKIKVAEKEEIPVLQQVEKLLSKIGNLVDPTVPPGKDEKFNETVKKWGEIPKIVVGEKSKKGAAHHHEILYMIDGFDQKRGTKVSGHRGYFLKGMGTMLNLALINYGLAFLSKRGYTPIQPPFFMKKTVMEETVQLDEVEANMYKVSPHSEGDEDMYLIATAEQPLTAFYRGEWLDPKELPIRFAGISSCFRKEAGAHGKQTWGTYRVHQFEKVEQLCITSPEESVKMHEEMMKASEDFYQSLGLPFRVVAIVAGELNNATSKKYDLEAWFPGYGDYMELVSCSNCTDYQSRALEIRYGNKKGAEKEKRYVHLLNGTLVATERTMCCILENYQTEEGVTVPEVLRPFMGGVDFIPYKKDLPHASEFGEEPKKEEGKAGKKHEEKDVKVKPEDKDVKVKEEGKVDN